MFAGNRTQLILTGLLGFSRTRLVIHIKSLFTQNKFFAEIIACFPCLIDEATDETIYCDNKFSFYAEASSRFGFPEASANLCQFMQL